MNDSLYSTQDIYLAATLSALDYYLTEIDQIEGKFIFVFDKVSKETSLDTIELDTNEYWAGNILIDPKRLFSEFKSLKARMYDQKRGNRE